MRVPLSRTKLSDGRDALFFHDSRAADGDIAESPNGDAEILDDSRLAEPRPADGTLRFDMLTGEWVAVATHRQSRTHLPRAAECPLCPTTSGRPTEIPAADFDVVVFENRFPSLGPGLGDVPPDPSATPDPSVTPDRLGAGASADVGEVDADEVAARLTAPARGRCEVIVFTPDHEGSFARLDPARARTVVTAWANRTEELAALPGIEQVFVFENRGEEIGVTMNHPHGQIYAYPYVTPHTANTTARASAYRAETGRTLMGDILAFEQKAGERLVCESEHFSAFVPFAARWPIEVHLVPKRQVLTLTELTEAERDDLAGIYPEVLRRIDGLYSTPTPYIAAWHQTPVHCDDPESQWMHLEITSPRRAENKLKYLAGSEAAMGAFISDVSAEVTAQRLRDVDTHLAGRSAAGSPAAGESRGE